MALGAPLMAATGYASPKVERTYERARELCRQLGDTPELFGVLFGLWGFHASGPSTMKMAHELAEQLLRLAQYQADSTLLGGAHAMMANTLFFMGELHASHENMEHGLAILDHG